MTTDAGVDYKYVRPLDTIEPTAIRVGLPVKTSLGFRQVHILAQELLQPSYETATIFIAEHYFAQQTVQRLIASLDSDAMPISTLPLRCLAEEPGSPGDKPPSARCRPHRTRHQHAAWADNQVPVGADSSVLRGVVVVVSP